VCERERERERAMDETKKKKKKSKKGKKEPLKLNWNECPLFMPRTFAQTVDFVGTCIFFCRLSHSQKYINTNNKYRKLL